MSTAIADTSNMLNIIYRQYYNNNIVYGGCVIDVLYYSAKFLIVKSYHRSSSLIVMTNPVPQLPIEWFKNS